jgi:hypothetical protein
MTVSPGTGRKFKRAIPMQLLLFEKRNAFLLKSGQKVQLPSE